MNYYIGVDGGGTKTQYALFDETKKMISSVKSEGTHHESLPGSYKEAAKILVGGINTLLMVNVLPPENVTFILMALAGMDHPYQEEALAAALRDEGLTIARVWPHMTLTPYAPRAHRVWPHIFRAVVCVTFPHESRIFGDMG